MFEHIISEFKTKVPLIVEGILPENSLPSTIIDATQYPYKLIRQGAMDVGIAQDSTS
jgi:tRNA A37 threonylcarbamoyladenosine synthetase subunit TsaC/SUA5/YrdC